MNRITLINFEWNCYNGFIFSLLDIECYKPIDMDSALFGINVAKSFLIIDFLFMEFTVFNNIEKEIKRKQSSEKPLF